MTLRSILVLAILALATPPAILASIAWSVFDRTGDGPHRVARLWGRILVRAARVRVRVLGLENIVPGETYVFAANHMSALDILVLLGFLPVQFRWIAKEELFRIPFFGRSMRAIGYIPVNRDNPRDGLRSLKEAARRIRAGASVIIFPEGTRSEDGRIGEFKRGGFTLAVLAGRPIVPISISGTARALPKNTLHIRQGKVRLVIGPPIPTAGLNRAGQDRVLAQSREFILHHYQPDFGGGDHG